MLYVYNETPIFITIYITEDVKIMVARKLLGTFITGGTDSEALQRWILKSEKDRKILCTSVEIFVIWIAIQSSPWTEYRAHMSGSLIAIGR